MSTIMAIDLLNPISTNLVEPTECEQLQIHVSYVDFDEDDGEDDCKLSPISK